VFGGLVLVVVAAGGGFVANTMTGGGDGGGTGETAGNVPTALATVEQKKLTAQTRVNGTLGYAGLYEVVNRASGTITRLPGAGRVITQGHVLYRVDGKPVILLRGTAVPAYRSLWRTMKGTDVRQLNTALVALGYADRDDLNPKSHYFGWSTYYALKKLQKKLGVSRTGGLELGQAVFLPAKQIRITKVNASYGATAPSGPIMEATSTDRHVTVALEASQVAGIRVKDKVTVTLPNLKETPGRVASIGTVAKKAASGSPTVDVRIKLSRPRDTGRLDQAPVQVAIVSGAGRDQGAHPRPVPLRGRPAVLGHGRRPRPRRRRLPRQAVRLPRPGGPHQRTGPPHPTGPPSRSCGAVTWSWTPPNGWCTARAAGSNWPTRSSAFSNSSSPPKAARSPRRNCSNGYGTRTPTLSPTP
jgi:peptidoglycan hydrolase-like protein with peptidoglycan-binding domain